MIIFDEISFIKRPDFEILNKVLNEKSDDPSPSIYGNLQMVFTCDLWSNTATC